MDARSRKSKANQLPGYGTSRMTYTPEQRGIMQMASRLQELKIAGDDLNTTFYTLRHYTEQVGKSADVSRRAFNGLATSYAKGAKDGKFTWTEFNAMMKHSPKLLTETSKAMGVTEDELTKMLKTPEGVSTEKMMEALKKGAEDSLEAAKKAEAEARAKQKPLTEEEKKFADKRAAREAKLAERATKARARAVGSNTKTPTGGRWSFGGISNVQTTSTLGDLGAKMQSAAKTKEDQMMESQQGLTTAMNSLAGKIPPTAAGGGLPVNIQQSVPLSVNATVAPG